MKWEIEPKNIAQHQNPLFVGNLALSHPRGLLLRSSSSHSQPPSLFPLFSRSAACIFLFCIFHPSISHIAPGPHSCTTHRPFRSFYSQVIYLFILYLFNSIILI
jgi:hypothetical protein